MTIDFGEKKGARFFSQSRSILESKRTRKTLVNNFFVICSFPQAIPGGNCVPCGSDVGHRSTVFPGGDAQETQVTRYNSDQASC